MIISIDRLNVKIIFQYSITPINDCQKMGCFLCCFQFTKKNIEEPIEELCKEGITNENIVKTIDKIEENILENAIEPTLIQIVGSSDLSGNIDTFIKKVVEPELENVTNTHVAQLINTVEKVCEPVITNLESKIATIGQQIKDEVKEIKDEVKENKDEVKEIKDEVKENKENAIVENVNVLLPEMIHEIVDVADTISILENVVEPILEKVDIEPLKEPILEKVDIEPLKEPILEKVENEKHNEE